MRAGTACVEGGGRVPWVASSWAGVRRRERKGQGMLAERVWGGDQKRRPSEVFSRERAGRGLSLDFTLQLFLGLGITCCEYKRTWSRESEGEGVDEGRARGGSCLTVPWCPLSQCSGTLRPHRWRPPSLDSRTSIPLFLSFRPFRVSFQLQRHFRGVRKQYLADRAQPTFCNVRP